MSDLRSRIKSCFDSNHIPTSPDFLASGICHFINDKGLEVSIEIPVGDVVIYFFSPLMSLARGSHEGAMKKALLLNGSLAETRGASIGIHPQLNVLGLYYTVTVDINFSDTDLLNYFNNFIVSADSIAKKLKSAVIVADSAIAYYSGAERRINWSK